SSASLEPGFAEATTVAPVRPMATIPGFLTHLYRRVSRVRCAAARLTDAAVSRLEVRLPGLAVPRHLTCCLDALAVVCNSEHHTLGKAGLVARPRPHIPRDRPAVFARDIADVEVQHCAGGGCCIVGTRMATPSGISGSSICVWQSRNAPDCSHVNVARPWKVL